MLIQNQKIRLLHELVEVMSESTPDAPALFHKKASLSFKQLRDEMTSFAQRICGMGLQENERIAVYLPKQFEAVIGFFGGAAAGGVVVPINPMLKLHQVAHILRDCNVKMLVTSGQRAKQLSEVLSECPDLRRVILTSHIEGLQLPDTIAISAWDEQQSESPLQVPVRIDSDMAAILYTSGSTGSPKGVVLSHANMVAAAESSADFLKLTADDRLLAILPLSFDYGLSQLTTAYFAGASVVLMDYLLPREVVQAVVKFSVTGISAVPTIWNQLAVLDWPSEAQESLRYITTSGGAAQRATLKRLKDALPETEIFQMYGLTEAFRSAYLPPDEFEARPGSVGKALPNVELMIVREDGSRCNPNEPGELVHRGSLVAMGYWNDTEKTNQRFRRAPGQLEGAPIPEMAVYSGDQMRMDEEGYLYFESRKDEMIKTSGYRVSPTEVEEVVFDSGLVAEVVAIGVTHTELGQAIVLLVHPADENINDTSIYLKYCQKELPTFMVPACIEISRDLPRNPNGKIDRATLRRQYADFFSKPELRT